jgi:ribosomal protein L7Ae-like RNA K-turn-binding protein
MFVDSNKTSFVNFLKNRKKIMYIYFFYSNKLPHHIGLCFMLYDELFLHCFSCYQFVFIKSSDIVIFFNFGKFLKIG